MKNTTRTNGLTFLGGMKHQAQTLVRALKVASVAIVAGALALAGNASAADTVLTVINGATDLTNPASYVIITNTAGVVSKAPNPSTVAPTASNDILFASNGNYPNSSVNPDLFSFPNYSPATFTVNATQPFGTINDQNIGAIIITDNGTAATMTVSSAANNTAGGIPNSGTTGATVLGTGAGAAGDLIFVAPLSSVNNFASGYNVFAGAATVYPIGVPSLTIQSGSATLTLALGAAGNIDNNGVLNISAPVTITGAAFTETFTGTGVTTISGTITGTATNTLLITTGTLALSGANTATYLGATTLNGGTLDVNSATALGGNITTTALTINGGALGNTSGAAVTDTNANKISIGGNFTFSGPSSLNTGTGAITLTATPTITVTGANTLTLGGVTGGAFGITKAGLGTLVLAPTAVDTYTGTTTINAGTLQLNFNAVTDGTGIIKSGNALTLGGGTLLLNGFGTVASGQTLATPATATVGSASTIKIQPNSATIATTLTIPNATIAPTVGTTLNFDLTNGTGNAWGGTLASTAIVAGPGVAANETGAAGSIINPEVTVTDAGGAYFATGTAANGLVGFVPTIALPATGGTNTVDYGIGLFLGGTTTTTTAGGLEEQLTGNVTPNSVTVNTTATTVPAAGFFLDLNNKKLGITSNGGMLFTGGNSYLIQSVVAGGIITSNVAGNQVFANYLTGTGTTLTIDVPLTNSQAATADSYTFSGTGTTILEGANTYTGNTYVTGGTLQLGIGGANDINAVATTGTLNNTGVITVGAAGILAFDLPTTTTYTGGGAIADSGTVVGAEGTGITNTLASGITGTGGFTQSGAGLTSVTTAFTYTGPTLITAGTLQAGVAAAFSAGSAVTVNGGKLDLNGTNETVASLSGKAAGTVTNSNAGAAAASTLTVNNGGVYTGILTNGATNPLGLTVAGGTLVLNGTGSTYSYGTINNGTLAVGNSSATTLGGTTALGTSAAPASGYGSLTNNSILETTATPITGVATTGAVLINAPGNFVQTAGSLLLLQDVNGAGGAPGTNYDSLSVAGVTSGVVGVSGTPLVASALKGAIVLNFGNAAVAGLPGQQFQLVSTTAAAPNGSIVQAAVNPLAVTVTGNLSANIIPLTSYNNTLGGKFAPNNIAVTLFAPFNSSSFTGLTSNEQNVGNALQNAFNNLFGTGAQYAIVGNVLPNLPVGSAAYNFFGTLLPGAELGGAAALDQLTPQRFEIVHNIAFDNYAFDIQSLDQEFARERMGVGGIDTAGLTLNDSALGSELSLVKSRLLAWSPAPEPGLLSDSSQPALGGVAMVDRKETKEMAPESPENLWNVFIDGGVDLGNKDAVAGVSKSSYTTGRVRAGADYRVCTDIRVGALFGYNHTDADMDNIGSKAKVDGYTPGVFVTYADKDGFYANGLFTYTHNDYSTARNIAIPGFAGTSNGSFSGDQFAGDADGGYDFHRGDWTFGPAAGLTYVNVGVDSFNETGLTAGLGGLNVNSWNTDSLRSRLGGTASYRAEVGSVVLRPYVSAFWQHEFLDNGANITSNFQGLPGSSFTTKTSAGDSDNALLGVGLNAELNKTVTLFVDYGAEAGGSTFFGQSASGGVKIGF